MSHGTMQFATGDGGSGFHTTQASALKKTAVAGNRTFMLRSADKKAYAAVDIDTPEKLAAFLATLKADVDRAEKGGATPTLEVRELLADMVFRFYMDAELDQNPKAWPKAELTTQGGIPKLTEAGAGALLARVSEIIALFLPNQPEALQGARVLISDSRVRFVWPRVIVNAKQAVAMVERVRAIVNAEQAEAMAKLVRAEPAVVRSVWICVVSTYEYGPPLHGSCEYAGTERREPLMPLVPLPEEMTEWLVVPPTPAQPLAWERPPGTPYPITDLTPSCLEYIKTAGKQETKVITRIAHALQTLARNFNPEYEQVQVTPECVIKSADGSRYIVMATGIGAHFCCQAQADHCDRRVRFVVTIHGIMQGCFAASALDGQCHAGSKMLPLPEGPLITLFANNDWQNGQMAGRSIGGRDIACPAILSQLAWAWIQGQIPKRSYTGALPPKGTFKQAKGPARVYRQ
jgi:hypothetical protein